MLDDSGAPERTEKLRTSALELGFHAFGVARAGPPDPEERLRAWLEAGMQGRMSWMADPEAYARRMDLQRSLPGARSVVALSISYYRSEQTTTGPLKVARYAQGADYHRWLKRRLRRLRRRLIELDPGCRVYPTVDTSPVLERAWAARAGIAWIGKSTMAIHPRLGTYTFLATLITDSLLLANPNPMPDRCGSCTACVDACPTVAFPSPGVLDARRCISHWTLEAPGTLPEDAPDLAGWVAGCDICQEVCPWNKFAREADETRTAPKAELRSPNYEVFTNPQRHEELETVIRGTALARTGAAALRRNARRVMDLAAERSPSTEPPSS